MKGGERQFYRQGGVNSLRGQTVSGALWANDVWGQTVWVAMVLAGMILIGQTVSESKWSMAELFWQQTVEIEVLTCDHYCSSMSQPCVIFSALSLPPVASGPLSLF